MVSNRTLINRFELTAINQSWTSSIPPDEQPQRIKDYKKAKKELMNRIKKYEQLVQAVRDSFTDWELDKDIRVLLKELS